MAEDYTEDHCAVDGCTEPMDDGEGWGALCGIHADQRYNSG